VGIKGFQGTSLLDFPGRIASLVFLGRCNLTCPFCHNPPLVTDPDRLPDLEPKILLAELESRAGFIDGVVFSGGEPTLESTLPELAAGVKALGLAVKLDTNGLAPAMLERLLDQNLLDYLAIDLKTSLARYPELHDHPVPTDALLCSVRLARAAPAELEFRTTCVPGWVDEEVVREWGEVIGGAPLWTIQQFHPEYALAEEMRSQEALPVGEVRQLAAAAGEYVQKVMIRGL